MIAQKAIDAKQSQIPRRPAIASPDPLAPALGTSALEHSRPRLPLACIQRHRARLEFKVAAVWLYSNRLVPANAWPVSSPGAPVAILFLWSLAQPLRPDRR